MHLFPEIPATIKTAIPYKANIFPGGVIKTKPAVYHGYVERRWLYGRVRQRYVNEGQIIFVPCAEYMRRSAGFEREVLLRVLRILCDSSHVL